VSTSPSGLIPDESPDADTVFDAPTDVFDG